MMKPSKSPSEGFAVHPLRDAVLGEVHARPFTPLTTPSRVLHFGFVADHEQVVADRAALVAWCRARSLTEPSPHAKHHRATVDGVTLSWEQHTEFVTYTWQSATKPVRGDPFGDAGDLASWMEGLPQPGPLMVAIDLALQKEAPKALDVFDTAFLSASTVNEDAAVIASDFRADKRGRVRILVQDRALTPMMAGALVQRLIEIETYRSFALMGLPEAQRVGPLVRRIEQELARIAQEMTATEGLSANQKLLDELTALAAALEAEAAVSAYRFGASRAYADIVQQRLVVINEVRIKGLPTFQSFLDRRMAPAMRTCNTIVERQADLSRKLTRAANLLRTRVDVELEGQNRDLLAAMNDRARMQLRLQQTVEGLSVAAIGYYVVSLFGYIAKGAKDAGRLAIEPGVATALFVPMAILAVWWAVRRVRKRHGGEPPTS
ncbi:MAG: DUF3422 family protein [Bosea sp. (in: a-proteobacteria)]